MTLGLLYGFRLFAFLSGLNLRTQVPTVLTMVSAVLSLPF